jgi:hypothetical protein
MANYYGVTRSNYFRVKNASAFKAWCHKRRLEFWTGDQHGVDPADEFFAISADVDDWGGWPSFCPEQDTEIHFTAELARHLDPRDVAVLLEAGHEKLRYLTGKAIAVHPNGRTVCVCLDDIYGRARKAFGRKLTITEGTY